MTPQELKNSVLQRAFQGKLVEQRPKEGTGKELFEQIQVAKATLIAKKEKALPLIQRMIGDSIFLILGIGAILEIYFNIIRAKH